MSTIVTLCARGGSKGLPGKNIRPFLGQPLLARAISLALTVPGVAGVYVSTDSSDIARVAPNAGAQVLGLRPAELATDAAPKLPALVHLLDRAEAHLLELGRTDAIRTVIDLQPTSPLTRLADVLACVAMAQTEPIAGLVTTAFDSGSNPYYTMVETNTQGLAQLSKPSPVTRRQDAPKVLTLNGAVYVWQAAALRQAAVHGLWSVPVRTVEMPKQRSADIDDATDWAVAECLARLDLEQA